MLHNDLGRAQYSKTNFIATPSTRAIPVIFLSALCDAEQKLRGFQAGCIDYITKPFEHREALARINAHLQQQRLFRRMAEHLAPARDGEAPSGSASGGVSADGMAANGRCVVSYNKDRGDPRSSEVWSLSKQAESTTETLEVSP